MEELRIKIIKNILEDNPKDRVIQIELSKYTPLKFIKYFLIQSHIDYCKLFFLSYLEYWLPLNYDEWKQLLYGVSHSSNGIYSFFVLSYKYLKLDFFPFFVELKVKDEKLKNRFLMALYNRPHYLQHDDEAKSYIDHYSLDKEENLSKIIHKLIAQGAIKAEEISAKPPVSWTWIDKLDKNE